MYVMSGMPASQQSIAGSILQMVTKLAVTVSFGLANVVFNKTAAKPSREGYYANNPAEPYAMVFWYAAGCSVLCVALCPFLTIKTQGNAVVGDAEQQGKSDVELVEPSGLGERMALGELAMSEQIPSGKNMADVVHEMQAQPSKDKVL